MEKMTSRKMSEILACPLKKTLEQDLFPSMLHGLNNNDVMKGIATFQNPSFDS